MTGILIMIVGILIGALLLNIPIAFALALIGFVIVFIEGSVPLSFFIQSTFGASDSFSLLAIPFLY